MKFGDCFLMKCYRTELISEILVYLYGPKNLPINIQYKSELILILLDSEHLSKTIKKSCVPKLYFFFFCKSNEKKRLFFSVLDFFSSLFEKLFTS